jgi:hypothetical protein
MKIAALVVLMMSGVLLMAMKAPLVMAMAGTIFLAGFIAFVIISSARRHGSKGLIRRPL